MPVAERFAIQVEPDLIGGCWLWSGSQRAFRYGTLRVNGRCEAAHRISWILHRGEIPIGMVVCHKCDVPTCVNPDHLFLGTQTENIFDMDRKGRRKAVCGEQTSTAKITAAQVYEIRDLFGRIPHHAIAERFGVSTSLIGKISRNLCWRHLPANPESYHPRGADPVAPAPLFDGGAA